MQAYQTEDEVFVKFPTVIYCVKSSLRPHIPFVVTELPVDAVEVQWEDDEQQEG